MSFLNPLVDTRIGFSVFAKDLSAASEEVTFAYLASFGLLTHRQDAWISFVNFLQTALRIPEASR
jgi:hypothetical protein